MVTITPVNDAPVFMSMQVTTTTPDEAYSYAITATDVDGDALTVTAPTLPAWLAFEDHGDGTALLEGAPSPADAGPHDVLLEVTDGSATVQQEFTVTVTVMDQSPEATTPTVPADGDTLRLEGDPYAAFIVAWRAANDPNGDVVTYRWELSLTPSFSTLLFNEDVGTATRFETTVGTVATVLTGASIPVGLALKVFHRVVTSDGPNKTVGPAFAVILMRGLLVGVEAETLPTRFALLGNYPNPFNPTTTIEYDLPEPVLVRLAIYDILGRKVFMLVDEEKQAGRHKVTWDAGSMVSGVYFYRIQAKRFTKTRKLILVK